MFGSLVGWLIYCSQYYCVCYGIIELMTNLFVEMCRVNDVVGIFVESSYWWVMLHECLNVLICCCLVVAIIEWRNEWIYVMY